LWLPIELDDQSACPGAIGKPSKMGQITALTHHAPRPNPIAATGFDTVLHTKLVGEVWGCGTARVEVKAHVALKRALAEQLIGSMQSGKLSKISMAQRLATSRSQLDRVLDPGKLSIQLDTLIKAASAVGRTVKIRLKRETKRTRVTAA
jgi:hypothetical protein